MSDHHHQSHHVHSYIDPIKIALSFAPHVLGSVTEAAILLAHGNPAVAATMHIAMEVVAYVGIAIVTEVDQTSDKSFIEKVQDELIEISPYFLAAKVVGSFSANKAVESIVEYGHGHGHAHQHAVLSKASFACAIAGLVGGEVAGHLYSHIFEDGHTHHEF